MTTTEEPRSYFSLPYINTGKITVKPSAGRDGYVSLVFADDLTLWTNSAGFARELVKAAAEALRLLDPPLLDSESWECQRCHGMYIGHRPAGDVCDHCQMLTADPLRCPRCQSPEPRLHPAVSGGGEVTTICPDPFHGPAEAESCGRCGATDVPKADDGSCFNLSHCADRAGDAAKATTP